MTLKTEKHLKNLINRKPLNGSKNSQHLFLGFVVVCVSFFLFLFFNITQKSMVNYDR